METTSESTQNSTELDHISTNAYHELQYREFWNCIAELDYFEGTSLNVYGWFLREKFADREIENHRRTHE